MKEETEVNSQQLRGASLKGVKSKKNKEKITTGDPTRTPNIAGIVLS